VLGDAPTTRLPMILLLVVCGICASAWHGVAFTQLATLAGAGRVGTALGMGNTSVFSVCFLAPLVLPHLLAWQGWSLVWAAASLCALGATPLMAGAPARRAPIANETAGEAGLVPAPDR
jgi:hypothetical protein